MAGEQEKQTKAAGNLAARAGTCQMTDLVNASPNSAWHLTAGAIFNACLFNFFPLPPSLKCPEAKMHPEEQGGRNLDKAALRGQSPLAGQVQSLQAHS